MSRVRGQLACTVLRGAEGREVLRLPDQGIGANVRKGERGTHVVFTKDLTFEDDDTERQISMLRSYAVFNVAQIDGLPERIVALDLPPEPPPDDIPQRFIESARADIRHGGSRACFVPSLDVIQLPPRNAFESIERYFATALHELGHNAVARIMPHQASSVFKRYRSEMAAMRHNLRSFGGATDGKQQTSAVIYPASAVAGDKSAFVIVLSKGHQARSAEGT